MLETNEDAHGGYIVSFTHQEIDGRKRFQHEKYLFEHAKDGSIKRSGPSFSYIPSKRTPIFNRDKEDSLTHAKSKGGIRMPDVKCSVSNCVYWTQENNCTANRIMVEIDSHSKMKYDAEIGDIGYDSKHQDIARSSSETCCHTFKQKAG